MNIRSLQNNEFAHWLPLWRGYLEFYESTLPPEITANTFARLCDPAVKDMGGYIAFDGDVAVGIVHYIIHKTCWSDKDVCYLQDLFVAKDARAGGIGRALIEKVADFARKNNLMKVYWQTQETNKTAQILYDKMAGPSEFNVYNLKL